MRRGREREEVPGNLPDGTHLVEVLEESEEVVPRAVRVEDDHRFAARETSCRAQESLCIADAFHEKHDASCFVIVTDDNQSHVIGQVDSAHDIFVGFINENQPRLTISQNSRQLGRLLARINGSHRCTEGCDAVLEKVAGALNAFATAATAE